MEVVTTHRIVITLSELEAARLLRYLDYAQCDADSEALDVGIELTRILRQTLSV